MSKKRQAIFCYSCDMECTISFSREEDKQHVDYCPFCGDKVEREETDHEPSDEDEGDDRWG